MAVAVVVTDLQRAGWEGEDRAVLPAGLVLDVRDAGAPPDNLSVAAVRVAGDRVVASVGNSGRMARTGQVRVERDGRTVATAPYAVPPGALVDVPIAYRARTYGSTNISRFRHGWQLLRMTAIGLFRVRMGKGA